tara:strand:+ start:53 stop:718 length:666 start_codon:yes stop_codon:yes gene_type:complete
MEIGQGQYPMEKLIRQGAEANIYLGKWFGHPAIFKRRLPKAYRQPNIDAELRRRRTSREASFMAKARGVGVPTPQIYFVDPGNGEIIMQHLSGIRVKDAIHQSIKEGEEEIWSRLGTLTAKLHDNSIVHGDLTTSNLILTETEELVLFDFGLSFHSDRVEDYAVDVHLLKEALTSAHSTLAEEALELVIKAYSQVMGKRRTEILTSKVQEIERRGRYARPD